MKLTKEQKQLFTEQLQEVLQDATWRIATVIHWVWSCQVLEEAKSIVPRGRAEKWLAPPPKALVDAVYCHVGEKLMHSRYDTAFSTDMAHWILGTGGASGLYQRPDGLPDWQEGGYTLQHGQVYLQDTRLGSVKEVVGIPLLARGQTPADWMAKRKQHNAR